MSAALKWNLVSVEDYLAGELVSPIKHEYLGGVIYAMAGARNSRNRVASNLMVAVGTRLRGKRCQVWNSDTKVRVQLSTHVRFYYPDVSVICRPNSQTDPFQDEPAVLFEVMSKSTRRIDEGEKKDAYLTIPSLSVYVLIETETPAAIVFRRTETGFVREVYEGIDAVVPLREIDLPLAEVYDAVEFVPEPSEDETA